MTEFAAIVPDYGAPSPSYTLLPGTTGYDVFGISSATGGLYVLTGAVLDFDLASALDVDVEVRC